MKVLIKKDTDWSYLLEKAHQHGVIPQLYKGLHDTHLDAVPTTFLEKIRHHFHTNINHTLLLTAELLKLLELFKSHEIPAFSFKGPVLAAQARDWLFYESDSPLRILKITFSYSRLAPRKRVPQQQVQSTIW